MSIRFGAFYLSHQLASMGGSLQAALSAYNGGPGNAQRWAGGTTVADPDLFTEGIDYEEVVEKSEQPQKPLEEVLPAQDDAGK